jgi:sec-independent protein translocase protein TatB
VFDIAPSEFLLVAIVALVVIGPKDLPRVMRMVGHWVGRARAMTRHFRSGIDTVIREAELDEMQRHWAAENERIMSEHPSPTNIRSLLDDGYETGATEDAAVTPPSLPAARAPEDAAEDVEPASEPVRRLRRGSEFDDGSGS